MPDLDNASAPPAAPTAPPPSPPAPATAPGRGSRMKLQRLPRTRLGGLWVALTSGAVVLLLLLIFILENGQQVGIAYMGAHGHLPLGVALLLAAVFGVLSVVIPGAGRMIQLRMAERRQAKRAQRMQPVAPTAPSSPEPVLPEAAPPAADEPASIASPPRAAEPVSAAPAAVPAPEPLPLGRDEAMPGL